MGPREPPELRRDLRRIPLNDEVEIGGRPALQQVAHGPPDERDRRSIGQALEQQARRREEPD